MKKREEISESSTWRLSEENTIAELDSKNRYPYGSRVWVMLMSKEKRPVFLQSKVKGFTLSIGNSVSYLVDSVQGEEVWVNEKQLGLVAFEKV